MNRSVALKDVAEFDPPVPRDILRTNNTLVAFLPMADLLAESSVARSVQTRCAAEVMNGYTYFQNGDVLVAKITPCFENGKTALAQIKQEHGFGTTEFHVIRPRSTTLHPKYLTHFLRRPWVIAEGERKMTGSAGQRRVPRHFLQTLQIPMFPMEEQRRIAAILDQAEALRAKRRRALAKLDTLTQSLFLEMFGDPIDNDGSWEMGLVRDYVQGFETGKSISAPDEGPSSNFRILKVSAVTSLRFAPDEVKPLPPDFKPTGKDIVKAGDLLFSRANTPELIGATAYVFSTPENIVLPDKLWRFVWKDSKSVEPLFVWHLFMQPSVRREIGKRGTGTSGSMKNISQEKVLTIRTIRPPIELQNAFSKQIKTIQECVGAMRGEAAMLNTLSSSLEHLAFRGEL